MGQENELIDEYRNTFGISGDHELELISHEVDRSHFQDNDDFTFEEYDPDGELVATYKAWSYVNIDDVFNVDSGYRKYSPNGELIEEG